MGTAGTSVGGASFGAAAAKALAKEVGADFYNATGVGIGPDSMIIKGTADGTKGGRPRELFRLNPNDVDGLAKGLREQRTAQSQGKGSRKDATFANFTVLSRGELKAFKERHGIKDNPKQNEPIRLPGKQGMLLKRGNKFIHTSAPNGELRMARIRRRVVPQAVRTLEAFGQARRQPGATRQSTTQAVRRAVDNDVATARVGKTRGSTVGRSTENKWSIDVRRGNQRQTGSSNPQSIVQGGGRGTRELSTSTFNKDGTQRQRGAGGGRKGFTRTQKQSAADKRQTESAKRAQAAAKKKKAKRRKKR